MKPNSNSSNLLSITKSKAKMFEYSVPETSHIDLSRDPNRLFALCISILGDICANIKDLEFGEIQNKDNLIFVAQFFESYVKTKLDESCSGYLLILSSAAYYIAGLPGNSLVIANQIEFDYTEDICNEHILLLKSILQNQTPKKELLNILIKEVFNLYNIYHLKGNDKDKLIKSIAELREWTYKNGNNRELLLSDIIYSIVVFKMRNSVWHNLPASSGLSGDIWAPILNKKSFIKELWPSQLALAKEGIFKGKSAIVQMPTSAGKTKSVEIMIRSSVLSKRSLISVIITPFRALCHEIKMELQAAFAGENTKISEISDVFKNDLISLDITNNESHVLIFTPEKFLYLLKHVPELSQKIGLIVFDEGHLFDSGKRGVTYELLLTDLKKYLSNNCQKILISAVISNAAVINDWLNGNDGIVVESAKLIPTYKNVGFVSWEDRNGQIKFFSESNIEKEEYFVPRIIESIKLDSKPREKKIRYFPTKKDKVSVAIYLGLKLVKNGGVAIFSGQKASAIKITEELNDLYSRNYQISPPSTFSDMNELRKLYYQSAQNIGETHSVTKAILLGVLSHHGLIPHGMKLSAEYAIRNKMAKYVICTSTLAQGVNLPIRYIIFTNIYQAGEKLKVRDFHNLIGRTGRAGIYTEGSILFSDPEIYDFKNNKKGVWVWDQIKIILNKVNSEPCTSSLLTLFDPILSDNEKLSINFNSLNLVIALYLAEKEKINLFIEQIISNEGFSKAKVNLQIQQKLSIIKSIENFLFSYVSDDKSLTEQIAMETLAYQLGNPEQRENLINLFTAISSNISEKIPETSQRLIYTKTLLGVNQLIVLDKFISQNIELLINCEDELDLFKVVWPFLLDNISNPCFNRLDNNNVKYLISESWIKGQSYFLIHEQHREVKLNYGSQKRLMKIEDIVEICDNALAFEGSVLVSAFFDLISQYNPDQNILSMLETLQSYLKYGLNTKKSVIYYEAGFRDRVLAQNLSKITGPVSDFIQMKNELSNNEEVIGEIYKYPTFFSDTYNKIMSI